MQCHGPISSFNFVRQDYDGNGVIEGVQTEVRGLLSKLALLLPPVGVAKTNHSPSNISITSSWTKPQLRAGYNYLFVVEDGSYGIHNLSYAVGLLKASIADLTGDGNNDSLPDSWQIQYFGSANNPMARPMPAPRWRRRAQLAQVLPGPGSDRARPRHVPGRGGMGEWQGTWVIRPAPIPSTSTRRPRWPLTRKWARPTTFRTFRP